MLGKRWIFNGFLAFAMLAQEASWGQSSSVKRPPQFVLLAFDGSYSNSVWQYSREFSKHQKNLGKDTRFTFFINPVYLLTPDSKSNYQPPGYRLQTRNGKTQAVRNEGSAIGWGDDNRDVSLRIDQMNAAFAEGHEIGSHAVGHFDGGYAQCSLNALTRKCAKDGKGNTVWKWDLRWTEDDWHSEFSQFYYILDNVFLLNNLRPTAQQTREFPFRKHIKGFRAPVLGVSEGLWPNLPRFGITYDTSKTNYENYWPQKNGHGTWNFPLAEILEPGGARRWISMDYNFCVRDSARILTEEPETMQMTKWDASGKEVLANKARDCLNVISEKQKKKVKANMMALYRAYFDKNYYGNRAPVHIGHHFSAWMSGAYYETFFEFADEVCGLPEVRCVTYSELQKFMDSRTSEDIEAYKKGQFGKLPKPKNLSYANHWDLKLDMIYAGDYLVFLMKGADAKRQGLKTQISVNGIVIGNGLRVSLADIRKVVNRGEEALVRIAVKNDINNEVATATYRIINTGAKHELVSAENIEERWVLGHLPEAHRDDVDFTRGH